MQALGAFLAALLFGLGLIVSGMSNPAKVIGFLDLAGHWDPSLAFVMLGAIGVAAPAFAWARRRGHTLQGATITLPDTRQVDRRLILGSLLFGIGWGLAGICPGPALVLVGALNVKGILFAAAMLAGMLVFAQLQRKQAP
ncbi:YeeE/YedE family protein [Viridibacterium curvum]|uniref:YeeE/YedE thiosulfate transporter family protein n=1 Tax=Viridibacterium curvum TaxID=1101404 RepID=A0ABP9R4X6_9RHOO